jgi:hypothetical protein
MTSSTTAATDEMGDRQLPGIFRRLPGTVKPRRCHFLASEATIDSSNNSAMWSGETAADMVLRELTPTFSDA